VELAARLGVEGALSNDDLSGLAEVPERQLDESLAVVGIGVLPRERVGEAAGRIDYAELAGEAERIAVGRLHLDAIALSDAGVEVETRGGEAVRPPPPRQLVRSAEGSEHNRRSGGNDALDLECHRLRTG
jgi:hypothetical protein